MYFVVDSICKFSIKFNTSNDTLVLLEERNETEVFFAVVIVDSFVHLYSNSFFRF